MQSPKLSDEAREEVRNRLAQLEQRLEEQRQKERERRIAIKYRKVRFFERRKIERRLNSLRRTGEKRQLSQQELERLHQLEQMLLYVKFYPKGRKYVSLLKEPDSPEAQMKEAHTRQRIWAEVMQRVHLARSEPDELAAASTRFAFSRQKQHDDPAHATPTSVHHMPNDDSTSIAGNETYMHLHDDFFAPEGAADNSMKTQPFSHEASVQNDVTTLNAHASGGGSSLAPLQRDTRADRLSKKLKRKQHGAESSTAHMQDDAKKQKEDAKASQLKQHKYTSNTPHIGATSHPSQKRIEEHDHVRRQRSPRKKQPPLQQREVVYQDEGRVEKRPARPRKEGGRKRVKRKKKNDH